MRLFVIIHFTASGTIFTNICILKQATSSGMKSAEFHKKYINISHFLGKCFVFQFYV